MSRDPRWIRRGRLRRSNALGARARGQRRAPELSRVVELPRADVDRSQANFGGENNETGQASLPQGSTKPARQGVRLSYALLMNLFGKTLGLAVLWAASSVLYDVVSSPDFRIERVSVAGNRLLTTSEIESAAAAGALNLFWIRRDDLILRLQGLPAVEKAWISLDLPDQLTIQVKEREPVAIWLTADTPFLVDSDGLVLSSREVDTPLLVVRDPTNQPLVPGVHVQPDAVRNVAGLDALLATTLGPQQRQYEYLPATGLNVLQSKGPRLVLGSSDELRPKIATVALIARQLEIERKSADLIDVRFREHPFYR